MRSKARLGRVWLGSNIVNSKSYANPKLTYSPEFFLMFPQMPESNMTNGSRLITYTTY